MSVPYRFLCNLLFPPVCRGCGARFDVFWEPDPLPLCPECLSLWQEAGCLDTAVPELLRQNGCHAFVASVVYHPGQRKLPERLILRAKDKRDRELFRFFAEDMRLRVFRAIQACGNMNDACIVYLPRRPEARAQAGHDQAEELARALGRAMELPVIAAIRHRRGTAAQKELSRSDRLACTKRALLPTGHARLVQGKTVLLVDDVLTSGATLAAASDIVLAHGATAVIAVTVALSVRDE